MALLVGYGAGAINPYRASSPSKTIRQELHGSGGADPKQGEEYIKAGQGVLKVMSKRHLHGGLVTARKRSRRFA
jgi:hypothetical protein